MAASTWRRLVSCGRDPTTLYMCRTNAMMALMAQPLPNLPSPPTLTAVLHPAIPSRKLVSAQR